MIIWINDQFTQLTHKGLDSKDVVKHLKYDNFKVNFVFCSEYCL